MSKVFESLVNGSLLDPIGGNNGTLTAGVSRGFISTDKGLALEMDGANTKVVYGDIENIKSIGLWINLDTTTEQILEGSANAKLIHANSGTLTYADFDNAYIDNVDTNTITIGWHCIVITSTTNVDMSAVTLALNNASYGKFQCARIQFWDDDISVKTRNDFYRDFLNAGQTSPQKRGFFVQKPTDLSRHTDDGLVAAYNMTLVNGQVIDLTGNGNDGTVTNSPPTSNGLDFNGIDGKIAIGNLGNIKSMAFRVKLDSTTEKILEGAANDKLIHVSSGTLTYPEFDNAFVDGIDTNTVSINGFVDIVIVSSTNVDMSAVTVALNNATYGDFEIEDLKIYNRAFTAQEAIDYHNSFILPTLVETFDEGADGIAKLPREWIAGTGTYKIDQWNVALGTQLSSWSNSDFDTFTSSGAEITSMVSGGANQNCYGAGLATGKRYKVTFTSSQALANCEFRTDSGSGLGGSNKQILLSSIALGVNTVNFVGIESNNRVGFYSTGAFSDTQITNFTVVEIEYEDAGPTDLVTNGQFDSDTYWAKKAGTTIADGVATITSLGDPSGTTSNWALNKPAFFTLGVSYTIVFMARQITGTGVFHVAEGYGSSPNRFRETLTSDWKTYSYSFTSIGVNDTTKSIVFAPKETGDVVELDNVQVYEKGNLEGYTPIKSGDKYLECTVEGTIATLSGQAYGTWEWDMLKGADGNASYIAIIADIIDAVFDASLTGYEIDILNTESFRLVRRDSGSGTGMAISATSYVNINQWYHVKVTRTKAGVFTVWKDGTLLDVSGGSGSNPVTDTNHTTSVFTVLDLDAGDRVANFNYKDEIEQ